MNGSVRWLSVLSLLFSSACFGGAWGVGGFENDSALDWSYELENASSPIVLTNAFKSVQAPGYKDVDACSAAMAAAEVVAAMKLNAYERLPEGVKNWATANASLVDDALAVDAERSVAACANPQDSELAQLWLDASDAEWEAYVAELTSRLQ